jgi:uridine kinase
MRRSPFAQIFILIAFLFNTLGPVHAADVEAVINRPFMPAPGIMVHLSPPMNPPMLKGIKVHADNPFRSEFILDVGDGSPVPNKGGVTPPLQDESTKLIKYFLASLTIPEKDLWVNLSPYEKDRIVPESFGLTEMGRDLLAQDYMLKQITASLIYPEDEIGKRFWKRVYEEAQAKYHTTNIPVNTFNKVWIVPDKAVVYENAKAGTAYVVESRLKVMLEQDYLSLQKQLPLTPSLKKEGEASESPLFVKEGVRGSSIEIATLGSQIIRDIVIPELTKEVNEGANFAQLRQVYNSLILATWYKKKIKGSILAKVYADKNKVAGVEYNSSVIARNPPKAGDEAILTGTSNKEIASLRPSASSRNDTELIYQEYLQAFKKGVYNYIKEEPDPVTGQSMSRKYFSGGVTAMYLDAAMIITDKFLGKLPDSAMSVGVQIKPADDLVLGVVSGTNVGEPASEDFNGWSDYHAFNEPDRKAWEGIFLFVTEDIKYKSRGRDVFPILIVGGSSMLEAESLRQRFPDAKKYPLIVLDPADLRASTTKVEHIRTKVESMQWPLSLPKPRFVLGVRSLEYASDIPRALKNLYELAEPGTEVVLLMNHPLSPRILKLQMDLRARQSYVKVLQAAVSFLRGGSEKEKLENVINEEFIGMIRDFKDFTVFNFRFNPIYTEILSRSMQRFRSIKESCIDAISNPPKKLEQIKKYEALKSLIQKDYDRLVRQYEASVLINQRYGLNRPMTSEEQVAHLEQWGLTPSANRALDNIFDWIMKAGFQKPYQSHISSSTVSYDKYMFFAFDKENADSAQLSQNDSLKAAANHIAKTTVQEAGLNERYVIGLGGPNGVGKTTFAKEFLDPSLKDLGRKSLLIHMDYFKKSKAERALLGIEWGPEHVRIDEIRKMFEALKAGDKQFITMRYNEAAGQMEKWVINFEDYDTFVFEGIWSISNKENVGNFLKYIDLPIYINADIENIEKWRAQQEYEKLKPRTAEDFRRHWNEGIMPDTSSNVLTSKANARFILHFDQERKATLTDKAELSKGGIDFNADKMHLETRHEGEGIQFKMDPVILRQLQNAPGFYPVIINIQPITDIRFFLGLDNLSAQTQKVLT